MRRHERQVFSFQHTLPAADWLNYSSSTARLQPFGRAENEAEAFFAIDAHPKWIGGKSQARERELAWTDKTISSFHLCACGNSTGRGKIAGCIHQATTRWPSSKLTITSDRRVQSPKRISRNPGRARLGKRKKERRVYVYIYMYI